MEIRDDDVLICSYPKTGLHWHIEIVNMLMEGSADMSNLPDEKICFVDSRNMQTFVSRPSPRLLATHVPFRHLPRQVLEKKIKIIHLDRNPKDTLVSMYHHLNKTKPPLNYPGTFEHFFHLILEVRYIYGDMFDHSMEWQNGIEANPDVPIYTSVYEDLLADPVDGVKKINQFLATDRTDELCQQIADACSFTNMKQYKERTAQPSSSGLFKDNKIAFYRKGEVGDWKNWFTVAMNEEFDEEYKKRMSEYKTVYKFTQ
ncbi:Sulfotransferase 1C4 [Bulinus truncatus]|nr:Sulfotransferase 1C4 [Bulinus truncatus]